MVGGYKQTDWRRGGLTTSRADAVESLYVLSSSLVSGEKTDFPSAENKGSERKSHQSVDRGTLTLNSTVK